MRPVFVQSGGAMSSLDEYWLSGLDWILAARNRHDRSRPAHVVVMVKDAVAGGQNRIRRNQKSSAGVYPAIGKGDGEIADGVVRRHIGTGNQIAIVFTDYFSRNLNGALGNII